MEFNVPDHVIRNSFSYAKGRPEDWRTEIPTYGKVVCPELWPGIDLLEIYKNGEFYDSLPYGGYIKDNETYVYPEGGFVGDCIWVGPDT